MKIWNNLQVKCRLMQDCVEISVYDSENSVSVLYCLNISMLVLQLRKSFLVLPSTCSRLTNSTFQDTTTVDQQLVSCLLDVICMTGSPSTWSISLYKKNLIKIRELLLLEVKVSGFLFKNQRLNLKIVISIRTLQVCFLSLCALPSFLF